MTINLEEYLRSFNFTFYELINRLELDPLDIAYATGSLVEGKGGLDSDLDVYVLTSKEKLVKRQGIFSTERKHQQNRRKFGIFYLSVGSIEVDVEFHLLQKFEHLIAALDALDPTNPDEINQSFDSLGQFERLEALELLHRFRIAKPFNNKEGFLKLRLQFDERKYFQWNTHYHLIQAKDAQKGTRRSLKEGDIENAYLKLTRLYDALVDAYLFSCNQSLDRWKWRLPKLRTVKDPEILDKYLNIQLLKGVNTEEGLYSFVEKHLESSFALADEIRAKLQTI